MNLKEVQPVVVALCKTMKIKLKSYIPEVVYKKLESILRKPVFQSKYPESEWYLQQRELNVSVSYRKPLMMDSTTTKHPVSPTVSFSVSSNTNSSWNEVQSLQTSYPYSTQREEMGKESPVTGIFCCTYFFHGCTDKTIINMMIRRMIIAMTVHLRVFF